MSILFAFILFLFVAHADTYDEATFYLFLGILLMCLGK